MIFKIISYLFLIVFSLIYTTNNYSNILAIIGGNIIVLGIYGLIFYHYEFSLKNKKKVILSILIALICSILTFGQMAYSYKNNSIEIKNISDGMVTIDAIYTDNAKQKIKKAYYSEYDRINTSNKNTSYQRYNKTNDKYKATLKPNQKYKINIKKKKQIKIELQRNTIDYNVLINNKKIKIKAFDYLLNDKAVKIYNPDYKYNYTNVNEDVSLFKTIAILGISFFVYFNLLVRVLDNKKGILLFLFLMLIEFNAFINIDLITKFVLMIIYAIFILKYDQDWEYKNIGQKILVGLGSIYISFSFFGSNLISENFNIKTFLVYIIFSIWIYLLFPFVFNFIKKIKVKNENKELDKKRIWIHRLIVFAIVVIIGIIYQLIFNPYILPPDGYMQLSDISNNTLSNWHPYMHTLLIKMFYLLFGDVKYFITFRIIIYACILTNILFYFYKKNMSLTKIYITAIFITILPVTGIFLVTMWKDVDFSLAILYLTFLIYLIIKDFEYFNKNKFNYLFLVICLICVGVFRHNGIVVMIFTIIMLLIYALKKKKKILLIILFVPIISVYIINKPLYKLLKVEDAPANFDVATILHGFNYLMYTDNLNIDSESYRYLISKMPKKAWKYSYDKYNIDLMLHYTDYDIRNVKLNKKKLVKLYMKQFVKTPSFLIKDRLYGTDIIWNVSEKDEIMTYKYQIFHDEFETNYAKSFDINAKKNNLKMYVNANENSAQKSVDNLLVFIANNEILNSLFFRVGIYIDILIILIIYSILIKKKELIICLVPVIINTLTLLLFMHHYEYRYVWNIFLISCLFLLIFIYNNNEKD